MIIKSRLPVKDSNEKDVKDNNTFKGDSKIDIETRINHDGEVNKARPMPQSTNIIATKTVKGEVHIFDYFKHPPKPSDSLVKPDIKLTGHSGEGYGLSWNTIKQGLILSGSYDHKVLCI